MMLKTSTFSRTFVAVIIGFSPGHSVGSMSPPINGNSYLPFAELMALDKLDGNNTFISRALAFAPAGGTFAYGGHVYAQAAWAAAQTVRQGFVVHNVSGYFLLAGDASAPFVYDVRVLRDGRGYCTRAVDAVQEREKGPCFTYICSFKIPEKTDISFEESMNLDHEYRQALRGMKPESWPEAPSVDSAWFWQYSAENDDYNDAFPGLSIRKVDMEPYNAHKSPSGRRQLQYYSAIGPMPPFSDSPNLHACAHIYASDRNGLFIISTLMDLNDRFRQMTSLGHSVILHFTGEELNMLDDEGTPRWFCQDARVCRIADGRGTVDSRLWSQRNEHIGTTYQDALARVRESNNPSEVNPSGKGLKGRL